MSTVDIISDAPAAEAAHLPNIRAVRLEIRVRWRRPTVIPGPVIANVLRGALGITLRQLVCPREWWDRDCLPCPLYAECAYGQIFMPSPPEDATQLRRQQDLPRPFVIDPPGLNPNDQPLPDGLTFRLMLFGDAVQRLPFFISTLDRLGHDGLGRDRVPFTIDRIAALHPAGDEMLFTGGSTSLQLPRRVITTADLLASPPRTETVPLANAAVRQRVHAQMGLPDRTVEERPWDPSRPRLRIRFLTPMLLKTGSGLDARSRHIPATEVRDRPPFGVIIRRLRDRLSALCLFFGDPWRHPDFAALGHAADAATLVASHTTWLTRTRRSTRTGDTHEISGFIGHADYELPDPAALATFLPLLQLGELVHVGKHAPWGNGGIGVTQLQGADA